VVLVKYMMVKLLVYHTGMCINGPESWWIAKSITPQLVVNQSKINPQRPKIHQLLGPLITPMYTLDSTKNLMQICFSLGKMVI
jgi:hypothetical protein